MGDEEGRKYTWLSLEATPEGADAPAERGFVAGAGRARASYPNGDVYEGGFNEALQKHGRGTYTWSTAPGSNPFVPEGDGYPEGKAPVVRYDGQYSEGKKQGVGKLTLPNGDRYHGQWVADRPHGEGSYFYANGDIYSGGWDKGVKSGEGTLAFARDGSQLIGTWVKGAMVSGRWVLKDGSSWHGPFQASKPLGRGVWYLPNGTMQEGEYVAEGDAEDPEADLKHVWRGKAVAQANVSHEELLRVV